MREAEVLTRVETWLQLAAALSYALGGACMKWSEGLSRPLPTVMLYALFALGASLQTFALRRTDLGVSYVIVLGLEAVIAFGLGVMLFQETVSATKLLAVAFIVAGVWLLS